MDKQAIKETCLKHGYKLKPQADGTHDLNAYVYDTFDEVLSRVRHGQQMVNLAKATTLSDALHLIQSGVRYKHDKDLEHGLELLRSTRDELCAVPNYHDDVALVGTKQVEFNITGVPDLPRKDSVHSVPYYPLDGEEQVTVIGSVDNDPINPNHYKTQSGVSCIDIAELFPYSLGNAIKYAWRAGKKGGTANDPKGREHFLKQDLEKCEWYLNRAIMNGEQALFMPNSQDILKAFAKFQVVKNELPEKNSIILEKILDGQLTYATHLIDDWLKDL